MIPKVEMDPMSRLKGILTLELCAKFILKIFVTLQISAIYDTDEILRYIQLQHNILILVKIIKCLRRLIVL